MSSLTGKGFLTNRSTTPRRSKFSTGLTTPCFLQLEQRNVFMKKWLFCLWNQVRFPFDFLQSWLTVLVFFSILTRINYYRPDSTAENLFEPTHLVGTILVGPGFPALRKTVKPNLVMFIWAPLPFRTLCRCVSASCVYMFTFATFWALIIVGLNSLCLHVINHPV